jgi:serine/threonine protein kinase
VGELHARDPNRIGPFELRGRLGTGDMGQVYLGQAPDGRLVAIKVVHDGLASDPQFRARFAREIETASRVLAPWAAEVIATDPDAARPWLACEYITGPSLEQAVTVGGPLTEPTLLVLAARLATALAELHAMGMLHRDLKPSNVLLAEDGPKLIDFGIAKALDATRMTSTGMAIGTPAFMSPEQANGDSETFASDVFSLAAVLVFAATGQGPFGPATTPVAMLKRIINDPPELTGVPGGLSETILR